MKYKLEILMVLLMIVILIGIIIFSIRLKPELIRIANNIFNSFAPTINLNEKSEDEKEREKILKTNQEFKEIYESEMSEEEKELEIKSVEEQMKRLEQEAREKLENQKREQLKQKFQDDDKAIKKMKELEIK